MQLLKPWNHIGYCCLCFLFHTTFHLALILISYHSNCRKSIFAKILTSLKECSNLTLKLPLLVCLVYNRCCCLPWNFKMFHTVSWWLTGAPCGTLVVWELPLWSVAAAKSLQSCPTLCDPIDRSPPGSPVPGILQARTLEWVAISVSHASKWKVKVKSLSRARLLVTPWTVGVR